jgi:hypothetical protein
MAKELNFRPITQVAPVSSDTVALLPIPENIVLWYVEELFLSRNK